MRQAYDAMRANAIEATALIEALIDFGEDEGISEGVYEQGAVPSTTVALQSRSRSRLQLGTRSSRSETAYEAISTTAGEARLSVRGSTSPSSDHPTLARAPS